MFETFKIDSLAFYEAIIQPAFADIVPDGWPFKGSLNEFTLMDGVVSSRPIIDIRRTQNILQRRDASCDINYKKLTGASTRKISTEEIYGATQFCRNEFYQGCLKEWRAKDPLFGNKILPYFQQAINADVASNAYFGDVDRIVPTTATWSTNVFDGVFKWMKRYITAGVIPAGQTIAIANGTDFSGTPVNAYNLIKAMHDAQPLLMYSFIDTQKAFYVSKEIYRGYEDYLISIGVANGSYVDLENGIKTLGYKGIPILEEPLFTPVISEIKGSAGYVAVLTLRGNFIFATDSSYGEGEDGKTALEVWYDKKDMTWYYRIFMKAGTQIALPEFVIVALSSFN